MANPLVKSAMEKECRDILPLLDQLQTIQSDIRKNRAMELLKTTNLTMENVASLLGFREVSSFYRAFKSWTGVTPRCYRDSV